LVSTVTLVPTITLISATTPVGVVGSTTRRRSRLAARSSLGYVASRGRRGFIGRGSRLVGGSGSIVTLSEDPILGTVSETPLAARKSQKCVHHREEFRAHSR